MPPRQSKTTGEALFEHIHPDFVQAIRVLDAIGLPHADLWRMLTPVAVRAGCPRPSYHTVRRIARAQRRRKTIRKEELDYVLSRTLRGLTPIPIR